MLVHASTLTIKATHFSDMVLSLYHTTQRDCHKNIELHMMMMMIIIIIIISCYPF